MTTIMSKLAGFVATDAGAEYRHVSEPIAKALPTGHPYSTRRWPHDNGDGTFLRTSGVFTHDAYFFQKEREATGRGPAITFAANDEILMCEWPTGARLRSIAYRRTVAGDDPDTAFSLVEDYMNDGAAGAFPAVTFVARDPADPNFPELILGTTSTNTEGHLFPAVALAYGINRRKSPLLISARVAGDVPANSGLFLWVEFVGQHL